MAIEAERIQADIDALARFNETPGEGTTRPTFSAAWRDARDYVIAQTQVAGCKHRIDAAGNVHIRPTTIAWESPAWLSGSYLDTVPRGGNYSGAAGVAAAMEVIRAARTDLKTALPMELVIWAEGTGATFGQVMLGCRAYVGEVLAEQLTTFTNAAGQTYVEAGTPYGVNVESLTNDHLRATACVGAAEVHPEEGGHVWNIGLSAGLVKAVDGRRLYNCTVTGMAADAGSTPMGARQDALAGAASMVLGMEKLARELGKDAVITVGRINCVPNVEDVIPGQVAFSIDFRHSNTRALVGDDQRVRERIEDLAQERGLTAALETVFTHPAVEMNAGARAKAVKGAAARGIGELMIETTVGVAHEAAALSRRIPAVMLVVAANPGAARTPQEYSRPEDIAVAAAVLFETVRDRKLE